MNLLCLEYVGVDKHILSQFYVLMSPKLQGSVDRRPRPRALCLSVGCCRSYISGHSAPPLRRCPYSVPSDFRLTRAFLTWICFAGRSPDYVVEGPADRTHWAEIDRTRSWKERGSLLGGCLVHATFPDNIGAQWTREPRGGHSDTIFETLHGSFFLLFIFLFALRFRILSSACWNIWWW